MCRNCTMTYSKGNGTGVADALGNWGFCNQYSSPGHEFGRIRCVIEKMKQLNDNNCKEPIKNNCHQKQEQKMATYLIKHSPIEARPCWTIPKNRPLITFNSTTEFIPTANKNVVNNKDNKSIPNKNYCYQGSQKWYKLGPSCCPQPSCLAPICENSRN